MESLAPPLIRFAGIEIDVERECVRLVGDEVGGGAEQRLRPKTFEVLLYLIENRGRAVPKSELFAAVWNGVAVTEDTLVQSIVEIRKALGDDPRAPQFVQTIPRVGYRIIAPIEQPETEPEPLDAAPASPPVPKPRRHWIALAIAAIAIASAAAWFALRAPSPVAEQRTSPWRGDRMTDNLEAYEAYWRGVAAADGLHNQEALAQFERAIALDPGFAMAYARIGYTYSITWMEADRAKPYFAKALSLGDRLSERERLYVLGWQAIASRDYTRAIDHFRLLISRYPTETEAYARLGRILMGEERTSDAIDVLRRGLAIDSDVPELHNSIGIAYTHLGDHARAIEHHRKFVALRPNEPNAYDSLGMSYNWAGNYDRALEAYDAALRLNPRFELAVVHRANTLWMLGRNREALRELRRFSEMVTLPVERARGYGELAILQYALGRIDPAALRQLRADAPDATPYHVLDAIDRGDRGEAVRLAESMRSAPGSGRGVREPLRMRWYVRTEAARFARDETRALQYARETLRHSPPTYLANDFEDTLGDTFAAFGRHREAADEYRRILRLNPNRGRTRYKLARALDALGQRTDARREYARFLDGWKGADADAPEMADAKRRL